MKINISKKMKVSNSLNKIVKCLEQAIEFQDELAISILTTRIKAMGFRFEFNFKTEEGVGNVEN
jgi:hypothetical protein